MKAAKWVGTVVCLLLTVALLYSSRRSAFWVSSDLRHEFELGLGTAGYGWRPADWRSDTEQYPPVSGWSVWKYSGRSRPPLFWWIIHHRNPAQEWCIVPLWLVLLPVALATGFLWYRQRSQTRDALARFKTKLCPRQWVRLTFRLYVACTIVHAVMVSVGGYFIGELYDFFFAFRPNDRMYVQIQMAWVGLLVMSPVGGWVWARLLVG